MNHLNGRRTVKTVAIRGSQLQVGDVYVSPSNGLEYEVSSIKDFPNAPVPKRRASLTGRHGPVLGDLVVTLFETVTIKVYA